MGLNYHDLPCIYDVIGFDFAIAYILEKHVELNSRQEAPSAEEA